MKAEQVDEKIRIVLGGHDLIDTLEPLWLTLFDHHAEVGGGGLPVIDRDRSWPARRALYERLFADSRTFAMVAYRDERAVGYVLAHVIEGPDDTWDTGDLMGEIETLVVVPDERGTGLGTRLLDRAEARLSELGAGAIWIKTLTGNDRARRFYEARGMTPVVTAYLRLPEVT
ncbi:MAG: GNAT family N-acetyltransferase [Nocardioides sp.]